MTKLMVCLLGGFTVTRDGDPVTDFDSNKVRALLAYLAVEANRAHRRESLAALLWPGYPESSARTNLRNALSNLRTAIGDRDADPPFLWITRNTLQFNAGSDHRLDVATVAQALVEADSLSTVDLMAASDAYAGDFLAGFSLKDAVDFDDWAAATRERLRRQALALLGAVVDRFVADGDAEAALTYARRRVELEPWHEGAERQLIRLLAATGQRSAALRQYQDCVAALTEELGAAPAPETVALYEELRSADNPFPEGHRAQRIGTATSAPAVPHVPPFLRDSGGDLTTDRLRADRATFVDREQELARLDGFLTAALAGRGQVAFVVGGPGRGKTSLTHALVDRAVVRYPDLLVLRGACNATSGAGDAYLPFRDALAMLTGNIEMQWRAGAITRDQAHRLWQALPDTLAALVANGPYLINTLVSGSELLRRVGELGQREAGWAREVQALSARTASGSLGQQALFQQVTNVLGAVSVSRPLLILLDDLQWADRGSIDLLFHLGRRLAGKAILIVGAYRPGEVTTASQASETEAAHPLAKVLVELKRRYGDVWIDLGGVGPAEGKAFVDALIDAEANCLDQEFREALYQLTGGQALFTVEILRSLRDRGEVQRDADAAWCEAPDLDWSALPPRVEAVIEERLGRLSDEQRELLAVASVEGEIFSAQTVGEVQGLGILRTLRILARELGTQYGLVREAEEVRVDDGYLNQFSFAHALYREALYAALSQGERRLLHGQIGTALETQYGPDDDRVLARLAHHFDQARDTPKAVTYAIRAGEHARAAYAHTEASTYYRRALTLIAASNPDGTEAQRMAALKGLGMSAFSTGRVVAAESHLRDAIAVGRALDVDPEALAILYWWLGQTLFWQERYAERVEVGEEGLALIGEATVSLGAALMNQTVGSCIMLGDVARSARFTRRNAEFIETLPYVDELVTPYYHLISHAEIAKDLEGQRYWSAALRAQAREHSDFRALATSLECSSILLEDTGDLTGALSQARQCIEVSRRTADLKYEVGYWRHLATVHLGMGQVGEARSSAERALDLSIQLGYQREIADCQRVAGWVALCDGDLGRAVEVLREAGGTRRSSRGPEPFIEGLLLLGCAYLASGGASKAVTALMEALTACAGVKALWNDPLLPVRLLAALSAASGDEADFVSRTEPLLVEPSILTKSLAQWHLMTNSAQETPADSIAAEGFSSPESGWQWEDPYGDCAHDTHFDLTMRAGNGRGLWRINLSAPRYVRPWPEGVADGVVQTTCVRALVDRPAIGGLLLWRTKTDYLWLEVGRFGKRDVDFGGCLDNQDQVIGRGRLPGEPGAGWAMREPVMLGLEIAGDLIAALCSLDGEQWYSVGHATFPMDDTVQIGVHAIGMIDRTIYHGAYPEGTAIRFTDFRMWSGSEVAS